VIRKLLPALLAVALLTAPLRATWSILVINTRTGEMVIASATCVDNSDLLNWTPVVLPGIGIAVCQAASPTELKVLIHDRMLLGHSPERIQTRIENKYGNVGGFQYAILDLQGRSLLFTGNTNGAWAGGVTGQVGDLIYSIQGNVLAGAGVVDEAEAAFLSTNGDLGQRVMAAMEAAMLQGGDGRCSCSVRFPDSCGTPPPNFTQSATIGYFVVTRPGDIAGACSSNGGCANGNHYLTLNEPFHQEPSTDPVILLRAKYDAWRLAQAARPDAFESLVVPAQDRVPASANALLDYWVELYDLDGAGLTQGGATFGLAHLTGSSAQAVLENVIDHQDGSYTLQVRSGSSAGWDQFAFQVDDGQGSVQLWPAQQLLHEAPAPRPLNLPVRVDQLGTQEMADALMVHDGAALWLIGDAGAGWELMRSERTFAGFYGPPDVIAIDTVASGQARSLWISEDELHGVVSLLDSDGIERLYAIERPDLQSNFAAPDKLGPLDEGSGARFPSLNQNRTVIFYESEESGTRRIYRAERLDQNASWFPGTPVLSLAGSFDEGRPKLVANAQVLAFDQRGDHKPRLHLALRDADGTWQDNGPIAGAHGLQDQAAMLLGWSETNSRAWTLSRRSFVGSQGVNEYQLPRGSFSIQPEQVSVSTGASLQFEFDAGVDFAGGVYETLVGAAGSGAPGGFAIFPLRSLPGLSDRFRAAVSSGSLPGLAGTLDGHGRASATNLLRAGTSFRAGVVGQRLHFAFLAISANATPFVSEAAVVELLP
jgi:uncharacterized protein DUF1028